VSQGKKHHYVPVFYQKYFADPEGLIWVYDRKLHTYKHLPPKVVCREEDLYAIRPEQGPRDRRLETDYLAKIDSIGADVLPRVAKRHGLSQKMSRSEVSALSMFIAHQFSRLPAFARTIRAMYATNVQQWTTIAFADSERAKEFLAEHERRTGENYIAEADSLVDAVHSDSIKIVATERPFLEAMIEHAEELHRFLE
jgi:hypothetical protein